MSLKIDDYLTSNSRLVLAGFINRKRGNPSYTFLWIRGVYEFVLLLKQALSSLDPYYNHRPPSFRFPAFFFGAREVVTGI